ncbi:hypothetical protein PDIG_60520 [Penicillium digitatum PHI26]|uniref:Uncharacterized protein n=2 Tax=Penicillium digitatum TaxID=36651 RepID=K9FKG3_PEND2|nr:hypothetical protein PDIP_69930 [Penicillium digitatum Pd1]EKV08135.1 hypothetical protein PDIP_69930 [Penicillium digitatum Pd1]EKV09729.1 hypothetical protein PDIG_60520 [Penicillium digitatum PHI26]
MSSIYRTRDDLRDCGTIPVENYETIAERLVITCKRHTDHRRRRKGGRAPQDLRTKYQESKAQKSYSKVLEDDPHIFIPFIIDISPRICESFDVSKFCETHIERQEIGFDEKTKSFLEETARRKGIDESLPFKKLMRFLFPLRTPRPITGAETQDHYAYYLAELTSIRNFFGDRIYEAVKTSATRIKENDLNPERTTTESVWTKIPRADNEDAIVHLDVGGAFELASDLFPQASQMVSSALSTHRFAPGSSALQADADLSEIPGALNEYGEYMYASPALGTIIC